MLKVLTVNIWHDQGPWPARLRLLRAWIERLDPDLIGFQEVLRGEGVDQLAELVEGRGYHTDYVAAMRLPDRGELDFGNAVASRWPIVDREAIALPDAGDWERRAALATTVDSPHGEIGFTCTHLNWRFHHGIVRERQVEVVAARAWKRRPEAGLPPIVVGDFNAEPDSDEIRYMKGLHSIGGRSVTFLDAWEVAGDASLPGEAGRGITWSNRNAYARVEFEPRRRIDYVFVGLPGRPGRGAIEDCRVVCDAEEDGVWPTDHFGVYAELRTDPA
jgi:endonuclease/exonuclease/phosphatase family metal-dependent hydrolase